MSEMDVAMLQIMIANRRSAVWNDALIDSMFMLRKKVFADRLQWSVHDHDGREFDRYDDLDPIYLVAFDTSRPSHALGCWRMLPTQGHYMLPEIFPALLGGHAALNDARAWEISRFAVADLPASSRFGFGMLATAMLRAMWSQGRRLGLREIVGVTSAPVERLLLQLGFQVERFAPPQRFGCVRSVAFRLPMHAAVEQRLFAGTQPPQGDSPLWRTSVGDAGELFLPLDMDVVHDVVGNALAERIRTTAG